MKCSKCRLLKYLLPRYWYPFTRFIAIFFSIICFCKLKPLTQYCYIRCWRLLQPGTNLMSVWYEKIPWKYYSFGKLFFNLNYVTPFSVRIVDQFSPSKYQQRIWTIPLLFWLHCKPYRSVSEAVRYPGVIISETLNTLPGSVKTGFLNSYTLGKGCCEFRNLNSYTHPTDVTISHKMAGKFFTDSVNYICRCFLNLSVNFIIY